MAVVKVTQSTANAVKGSAFYEAIKLLGAVATAINDLTAKLDADPDITATDWASTVGTLDTISFRETGTPD